MTGLTRGRLPARVYWVRRLMVLGIATLLVVGIAKMLGGSSDGSSGSDTARHVADAAPPATETSTPTASAPTAGPPVTGGPSASAEHHRQVADDPVSRAAIPTGPCRASDIAIAPSVPKPVAGSDITLVLDISSLETPACTWTLSGDTLALKITSGNDLIWTSKECPKAIPAQDLVVRQADSTRVRLTWDARRSAPGCPVRTEWALPGTYHLHVAALAGRPQDIAFLMTAPSPPEVTKTAHPHQHAGHDKSGKKDSNPS